MFLIHDNCDLHLFLKEGWWYLCLNKFFYFCYVNKGTDHYFLHERVSINQCNPDKEEIEDLQVGCFLVFKFVRNDRVARKLARITSH